ncbi:sensor histidine kinase [Rhabdaerophilum calidifontis]|uniref:sensor histidine kinase n=1 Tax=Rhabdaerophilum calidifontis TaxID=2604328 RepID=UPI00123948F3|nr:sensor histidine kinase [Rhabdaerophilum calidifontis]
MAWRFLSPINPGSLAGRLFLSAIVLSTIVLVAAGTILSTINRRSVEAGFDERLKLYLKVLVADVAALTDGNANVEPGNLGEPQFQIPLSGWYWQIVRVDREAGTTAILRTSRSLFSNRLPALVEPGQPSQRGDFRDGYLTGPEGRTIRIVEQEIDLGEQNRFIISVAGNSDEIVEERRRFDLTLSVILTLLGLALAASAYLQVRFGLRPLRRLSRALARVRAGEKEHVEGSFPDEVAPLAQELNQVLDVNREIVARARRQVGNLAHALKTPLSVLINEASGDSGPLAEKVREQSALMRDQVQYYLDRAQAAARAATIGHVTEIEPVIAAFIRAFEKIYRDREVRFEAEIATALRFRGEKQDLEEAVGNLVDNAGKWAQTRVVIRVQRVEGVAAPMIALTVDDDGPGLPEAARVEATKRGRRLDETKPGSGLGLSIVVDLATLYGGHFALEDSPLGGLRARLVLPAL